jgi:hypothetical protein
MPVCLKYCILGGEAVALGRRREQEEERTRWLQNQSLQVPVPVCTHDIYIFYIHDSLYFYILFYMCVPGTCTVYDTSILDVIQ